MTLRTLAVGAALALAPATAYAQQPAGGEIETQALAELDAWTVGALTQSQGALGRDLWARTDPETLALALDRLPAVYESPAALALARRVLLSGGEAPRGDAAAAARKRFEALGRMGAAEALSQMAAGAGQAANDPLIAQYAAQAELARGRRPGACARGRGAQGDPTPFILRLRAFCAAAAGDRAAADLMLELARANGGDDAWYTGAIGVVGGATTGRPAAARYDNSLAATLSLAAQLRAPPNPLNNASTMALATLARNDATPQPIRAQAAALAFRRGALTPAEARAIFAETPAEITSALPPLATALRQIAAAPDAGASAIATALRQAANPAEFHAAAQLFKNEIAALPTAPDTASTLLFARAALSAGDASLAQRLIESARAANADAQALAPLDAALAMLQGARGAAAQAAVQRRIDAGASAARAAARDVALMGALGLPLDGAAQRLLLANPPQGGARADAGVMAALNAAIERNASGEAALLAAIAAGDGVARLDAESAAAIVRALRQARLTEDARRFAVEAVLAGAPG